MSRLFRTFAFLFLTIAFVAGCGGGDGTTEPDPNAVATVSVSPPTSTLASVGATTQLSAEARNSSNSVVSGKTFTWTSLNQGIATVVSSTGVVTAVAPGTATIRATVNGASTSGTAQVTVQAGVASVAITQASSTINIGATMQLTATARDAGGTAIPSAVITWSTSSSAVASVNPTTGLVTGASIGAATITATSGTKFNSITVNVTNSGLVIAKDTAITGAVNVTGFSIAAGFTVTVNGPLTLHSTRLIHIAGTLTGNCQPFDIVSDTAITITGTVSNGCAAETDGVALRIAATGELTLQGAQIVSTGDIRFSNNGTLAASGQLNQGSRLFPFEVQGLAGTPFFHAGNTTIRYSGAPTGPNPARAGANGVNGGQGVGGKAVVMELDGNAEFIGNTLIWGQDGGAGGSGTNSSTSNVVVNGAIGGGGGLLKVTVGGRLTYSGAANILRSGRGARGGNATSTSLANSTGTKAPNASSVAGAGGDPGLVEISATGGIFITDPGSMVIEIGSSGDGGDATATAAHGANATPSKIAQIGGDAFARGGKGGGTPNAQLIKMGTVNGPAPIVRGVLGGQANGGKGGQAKADAGTGGTGEKPNKNGAFGGGVNSIGGEGGSALLRDMAGAAVGIPGFGGRAWLLGANGGEGWSGCTPGNFEPGGNGATAGSSSATEGRGGMAVSGLFTLGGGVRKENFSNGGRGGRGLGPGNGGAAGAYTLTTPDAIEESVAPVRQPGAVGTACPLVPNFPPAASFYVQINGWPANTAGFILNVTQSRPLTITHNGTSIPGSEVLITTLIPNAVGYYVPTSPPPRLGHIAGHAFDLNTQSFKDGAMVPIPAQSIWLCFLNENPVPSPSNPIRIWQTDFSGVQIGGDILIDGPGAGTTDGRGGCKEIAVSHTQTWHVRWQRLNGTSEVDVIAIVRRP